MSRILQLSGSALRKYASPNIAMIYLSVYLILQFLSSIFLLIQCGGKKKTGLKKGAKPATPTPASAAAKAEEKKPEPAEKKEDAKQEPSKPEEKKSAEKDEKKKEEKSDEKKVEEKKEDELKVDPTPQSVDDDKKQKSKQGEPSVTKSTMGKPDENIKLSASSLAWEDKEAQQVLKVTNNTEKKQALKIKCSNNSVFKVNPVFAMIELGKTLDIVVTRKNGPLKTEKLLILTTPFEGTEAEKAYEDKELIPACATVPMVPK
ncbi:hypothetical protein Y032_0085g1852 [Ancylostoma ceylanicum]|uniref:Major sperm protein n=1 Tax=Ancylostoma ceylanicum TaxID=53326 RepID=A0A016TR44_9BILA|nr:hypothetical protein Y032_0085g1852 [Ancylostoma ceylanicum]